jgi:hypothetical protein
MIGFVGVVGVLLGHVQCRRGEFADGLVLFDRFLYPDIDSDTLTVVPVDERGRAGIAVTIGSTSMPSVPTPARICVNLSRARCRVSSAGRLRVEPCRLAALTSSRIAATSSGFGSAGDDDGAVRVPHHRVAHRAEQHPCQPAVTAGTDHQQARAPAGLDELLRRQALDEFDMCVEGRVLLCPPADALLGHPCGVGPDGRQLLLRDRIGRHRIGHHLIGERSERAVMLRVFHSGPAQFRTGVVRRVPDHPKTLVIFAIRTRWTPLFRTPKVIEKALRAGFQGCCGDERHPADHRRGSDRAVVGRPGDLRLFRRLGPSRFGGPNDRTIGRSPCAQPVS